MSTNATRTGKIIAQYFAGPWITRPLRPRTCQKILSLTVHAIFNRSESSFHRSNRTLSRWFPRTA